VDWLKEDIPPAEPIAEENLQAFEQVKSEKMTKLLAIPYSEKTELLTSSFADWRWFKFIPTKKEFTLDIEISA